MTRRVLRAATAAILLAAVLGVAGRSAPLPRPKPVTRADSLAALYAEVAVLTDVVREMAEALDALATEMEGTP